MKDFVSADWERLAQSHGLDSFSSLWTLDIGWVEAPNRRRGGWSGVSRHELERRDGALEAVYIKRQQNHTARSWWHPLHGVLTFRREFDNLRLLQSFGVPSLELLYFAERMVGADRRAILVTRELAGYASLDDCMKYWKRHGFPERAVWQGLLRDLAAIARRMHRHRLRQNCFYPKHVFIGEAAGEPDIRLLDFEKARRTLSARRAMLRDLDTLNRHSPDLRTTDRLRFLLAYFDRNKVDRQVRKAWQDLVRLARRKSRNRTTG
jgi:hypothetical protein